jgi:hypothetical protein
MHCQLRLKADKVGKYALGNMEVSMPELDTKFALVLINSTMTTDSPGISQTVNAKKFKNHA